MNAQAVGGVTVGGVSPLTSHWLARRLASSIDMIVRAAVFACALAACLA